MRLALAIACNAALALAASLVLLLSGASWYLSLPVPAALFCITLAVDRGHHSRLRRAEIRSSVDTVLESIGDELAAGGSTLEGIARPISCGAVESKVAGFFSELRSRLLLGQPLGESVSRVRADGELAGQVDALGYLGASDEPAAAIRAALEERHRQLEDSSELKGYSIQKYVTLSMVSSTVIPSLALFGFTGYAITGPVTELFPLFLLGFTCAMPFLYRVIRVRMADLDG